MKKFKLLYKLSNNGVDLRSFPDSKRERRLYLVKFEEGYTVGVIEGGGGYNLLEGAKVKEDAIDAMIDDLHERGGTGTINFIVEGE